MALFGAHNIQVLSHARTSTTTSATTTTTNMVANNYSVNATGGDFIDLNSANTSIDNDYDNIIATAPIDAQFVGDDISAQVFALASFLFITFSLLIGVLWKCTDFCCLRQSYLNSDDTLLLMVTNNGDNNNEMDDGKALEVNHERNVDSVTFPNNQHITKGDCPTCVHIVAGSYRVIVPTIRSVKLQSAMPVLNQTPAMVQTHRLDYHHPSTRAQILMRRHSFLNSILNSENNTTSS